MDVKFLKMIPEFFSLALRSFSHKPTRTLLTLIGIFIGIAAVVSLFSLGKGLENAISGQFQALGNDKIFITPGSGFGAVSGFGSAGGSKLLQRDLDEITRVGGVKRAAGMAFKSASASFSGEAKESFILGIPTDEDGKAIFQSLSSFQVAEGRRPHESEKNAMVVGYLVAHGPDSYFKKPVGLGERVKVGGVDFKVVGIIERIGSRTDDTQMYIPLKTAQEVFGAKDFMIIYAQVDAGAAISRVAEDIKQKLRSLRGLKKGNEDFSVQTPEQLLGSFSTILSVVQAIVLAIASISLFVGGIGIMNTMYTAVLERTREIGIMKAIGARNRYIAALFVIEAGLLGTVGGAIGAAIGIGLSLAAEFAANQAGVYLLKIIISPELVFGAIAFSFAVGVLSGVLPALQAAKLSPVEALRYE